MDSIHLPILKLPKTLRQFIIKVIVAIKSVVVEYNAEMLGSLKVVWSSIDVQPAGK